MVVQGGRLKLCEGREQRECGIESCKGQAGARDPGDGREDDGDGNEYAVAFKLWGTRGLSREQ